MGLLSSVSKYYKMSFDKNVLIYVQRPDAGLLATKAGWEKQTGRYLKAGSKGIGVVDMNDPKATLAYYFDLADTRGSYEGFRKAMGAVWSLERQYQPEILRRFHERFGIDGDNIENCLCQLSAMQADLFLERYLSRVEVKNEDSVLYGLPIEAVRAEFARLASDSAAYIVFKKCGIGTEPFEETGAFENISHFGSLELFMGLGYYACAIARPVLSEIHKQIEEIKEERSQGYGQGTVSKTGIQERGGRDAVPGSQDLGEQRIRPESGGDVREKVERLHDVQTSAETVGTDRTGTGQRDDYQGGPGGGEEERGADTAAFGGAADAGNRGHAGEGRAYGDDNQTGGGNRPAGSGISAPVAGIGNTADSEPKKGSTGNTENTGKIVENDAEESKAENAAEGSFFRLQESATKENVREHKDWDEIQRLLTDTSVYPQDLYDRINQVFRQAGTMEVKRDAVRDIYRDYGFQKSSDGTRGIVPGRDVADFFFGKDGFVRLSWDVIAYVIGSLIEHGEYLPYCEEDAIDDYNIPDEDVSGEDAADEDVSGEDAAGEDVSDEDAAGEDIPDKGTSGVENSNVEIPDGKISNKDVPDEDISAKKYSGEDISNGNNSEEHISGESISGGTNVAESAVNDHGDGQLSLFEIYLGPYGEDGIGGDQILRPETEQETETPGYMPFPVGSRIAYDSRIFEVLGYLDGNHTAELGDIEQLNGLGGYKVRERLPVALIENAELLKPFYTDAEISRTVIQAVENGDFSEETKQRIETMGRITEAGKRYAMELAGEMEQRFREGTLNYRYQPEHHLYDGGPKTKFRSNVEAIRLLKQLQQENRMASAEEQIILARFAGWGGLANALTPGKSGWEKEYDEITELLTEEEMQSATASTLTSYYTDQKVIQYIYKALYQFGFRSGNILDPALGTGNFFSALPEEMSGSKLYGVELEPVAGGIARKLYPQADILIKGYEDTDFSDSFFDVVVGNVPFHSIRVSDRRYDRYKFRIHDYFLAKSLDKLRAGGIMAVITTKFTMDKENQTVRKYLAQRAELIGAIRLPEDAFKQIAGTEATTDILFLKKRTQEIIPDERNTAWLSVEKNEDGIPCNSYFIDHPEMVLGTLVQETGMYGSRDFITCKPYPDRDLGELLSGAVSRLHGQYEEPESELSEDKDTVIKEWLPAAPDVKNYSYAKVGDVFYYREDSRMYRQELSGKKAERLDGLLRIRGVLRELMDFQLHGDPKLGWELPTMEYETKLSCLLERLNREYDGYIKKYGYLNSQGNVTAFAKDADAPLLRSIEEEVKDEHGKKIKGEYKKTAVFHKATIRPKSMPKTADSIEEALRITLNARGKFDLDYMQYLYRKDGSMCGKEAILEELGSRVYQDPAKWQEGDAVSGWVLAEEYLSGHVKDKLAQAMLAAEKYPKWFGRNVEALTQVQPEPLKPEDISFVLGSTWIPVEYYQDFMYEKFGTGSYNRENRIRIEFAECTGTYFITNKNAEWDSVAANKTYGTDRLNAYAIMEYTLNLKTVEVRDRQEYTDPDTGEEKVRYVLNRRETLLAREKQAQIKMEFESWLFAEPERGAALTLLYNDRFNNIRPRTYNGDGLMLPDMNETITLRKHQRDTVAMGIYGDGNLLVAHEVGAGKTMTACAIAYERKRLGVCNKPLIAVPNHTLEQWATEFMRLYPNANILVATSKDFEKSRRRRFVSRIATGDYDCIIMGHSSFELIALSRERQMSAMQEEIDEITQKIDEMKLRSGKTWTLKQMEIFKRNLQDRFDRLYNAAKKDDTISFEELGVDNLFVDEAHAYKNNYSYTKMQRVAGVGGQSSQRAMDMHMKCQYINELTEEHGVVYLTGTPVSNSMSELYVMQKTLQPSELKRRGLLMFDAWASTFGRVESSLEIKPEGSGYQMKARFAKFHNLPELMSMLFLVADIKTADMLALPVPQLKTGRMQVVKTAITPDQKAIMEELVERAEAIRNKEVDSSEDNFLKLTNEARLLSVDPRILDETLENDPDTKLNACAGKVAEIYHATAQKHSTQLIFCDKGTPKADGRFNFYQAMKEALISAGVAEKDIAFIHEANTDAKRAELLEKVRGGEVRILMGSTEKMGTGLNVQDKMIALHNLDAPWRPADLTQRNGRILRQGNENGEVSIFNYITEQTFDAYLWQILEQKQKYISQIMTGRSALRSCEDVDEVVLQYAEFKALAVSDPKIKRKMEVDNEVYRLQTLKSAWKNEHSDLQLKITHYYPQEIEKYTETARRQKADAAMYAREKPHEFSITLNHRMFDERAKAGEYLKMQMAALGHEDGDILSAGTYAGFQVLLKRGPLFNVLLCLKGEGSYQTDAGDSALGNITRLENLAEKVPSCLSDSERRLGELQRQFEAAEAQAEKPFDGEEKLSGLLKEQVSLNLALEFADAQEEPETAGEKKAGRNYGCSIYRKLHRLAQKLFDGTYTYMKFKQDGFDDLVLENIGENEYSIAHYYTQNGDRMRDPEITFLMDAEGRSVYLLSYTQDNMGIYYETSERTEEQIEDLLQFFDQWLMNIRVQGFTLHEAHGENAEYIRDEAAEEQEDEESCEYV